MALALNYLKRVDMPLNKETNNNHHHHVVPPARISLTLSRHFSQSFIASGRSSGLHLHIAAVCTFELVVLLLLGHKWGSIGVHHLWARDGNNNHNNICYYIYLWYSMLQNALVRLSGGIEYIGRSVLYMTINNLMVRL